MALVYLNVRMHNSADKNACLTSAVSCSVHPCPCLLHAVLSYDVPVSIVKCSRVSSSVVLAKMHKLCIYQLAQISALHTSNLAVTWRPITRWRGVFTFCSAFLLIQNYLLLNNTNFDHNIENVLFGHKLGTKIM